ACYLPGLSGWAGTPALGDAAIPCDQGCCGRLPQAAAGCEAASQAVTEIVKVAPGQAGSQIVAAACLRRPIEAGWSGTGDVICCTVAAALAAGRYRDSFHRRIRYCAIDVSRDA